MRRCMELNGVSNGNDSATTPSSAALPAGRLSLHVIVANPARVENPSNPKQRHTDSRNSLRREVAHRTSGELSIAETELKTRAIPLAGSSATKSQSPGFSL